MTELIAATIVVASHRRQLRLRWLLNALEEQQFDEPWEVIVVHTYSSEVAAAVMADHALMVRGLLRERRVEPRVGSPALQRNIGWRAAGGELIAFTDDDCRPRPDWLAQLVDASRRCRGGVAQGTTRPDPYEADLLAAPHVRTLSVEPVGPYAQTCNMLYPRVALERTGGFDECAITGEDVDLSLRVRAAGFTIGAAPRAVVYHSGESHTLPCIVRQNLKWRHLAYLVKRHPEFREVMPLRVFWDREHALTALAVVGAAGASWRRALLALGGPYLLHVLRRRGSGPRAYLIATAEAPGQAVRQVAELVGLFAGAVRHRTPVL